jgi:hypothetical protein
MNANIVFRLECPLSVSFTSMKIAELNFKHDAIMIFLILATSLNYVSHNSLIPFYLLKMYTLNMFFLLIANP